MTTEIHTLVGAYVLDAVDDIERASFERHLRECDSCRLEVDEFRETTAQMAHDTWSVPPPWLRDNVMSEISRTRQAPPVIPEAPAAPPVRGVSRRRWLVSAAAVVVAAAGAGSAVYVVQDQRVRDQRQIAEAARVDQARVRQILAAPDVVLNEQPVSSGGRVTVASSRLHNAGVVLLAADAAPAGRVYQLWTIRGGGDPVNAGVLADGQSADVVVVEGLPGASDVAVSLEPPGGSAQPTSTPVADVKLT
ncbi:anti-sigma factor [Paractinoplanes lichenicola]|uniref:Regulator of SigK n=1 Tax=Paractinoplanes lichenicola TaxID=2802976 RepID=A0ABS1VK55_9ACTN|nr:anti-sigma factor [Actinoplanes lichenicola]MBL7255099.1 anti-sigma factor [Actinoplanes lichenicola]